MSHCIELGSVTFPIPSFPVKEAGPKGYLIHLNTPDWQVTSIFSDRGFECAIAERGDWRKIMADPIFLIVDAAMNYALSLTLTSLEESRKRYVATSTPVTLKREQQ